MESMNESNDNSRFDVGGQAVIEGVMMRGPRGYVTAVRVPSTGEIVTQEIPYRPLARRWRPAKWPVLRGAIGMIEIEQMFGRVAFYEATNPDTIARYRTLQRARRKGARRSQGPKAAEQAARRSSRSTVAAARNLRRRKAVAP